VLVRIELPHSDISFVLEVVMANSSPVFLWLVVPGVLMPVFLFVVRTGVCFILWSMGINDLN